jgi:hypothetical protein
VIGAMAAPFHLIQASWELEPAGFPWWPALGLVFGLAVGGLAVVLPLRAGARNLRAMEF